MANEEEVIRLAEAEHFTEMNVIPAKELIFNPVYRKSCEQNLCGAYEKNYACPPYCGTPEEMKQKCDGYTYALVMVSKFHVKNALDFSETNAVKKIHNDKLVHLAETVRKEKVLKQFRMIAAGPCSLCRVCGMAEGRPCPRPDDRFSCLSAYCIDSVELAHASGIKLSWDLDQASFFGILLF